MGIKFEIYNDKSDKIYYYTHQGLGDLIACSSIVNFLSETYPEKTIFYVCQTQKHASNVNNLIKNKNNVKLYVPKNWEDGRKTDDYDHLEYFKDLAIKNQSSLVFSGGSRYFVKKNKHWDFAFYDNIGLEYSIKYEYFYIDYDEDTADKTFYKLTEGKPYIFIHDDPSRGRVINIKNENNLKIVRNDKKYSIYDYIKIITNANECHMMGSSLLCLIDFFNLNYQKCKYHFYDFRSSDVNFKDKQKWIKVR
jgi:hypothetical protein